MSYGGPPVPPAGTPGWNDSQAQQRPFDNAYSGGYYQSPAPQYGYAPTGGPMNMNFPPPPITMAPQPGHPGTVYFQPDMAQPPPMPPMSIPMAMPMGMPTNYASGYDSRVSASDRLGPPVSSRDQYQDSHLVQDDRYEKPGRDSRSRDEERSYKGERSGSRGEKDRKTSLSPVDDRRYRESDRDDGSGSYRESGHDDGGRGRKQKHEKDTEYRRERESRSGSRRQRSQHGKREGEPSVSIDALLQDERLKNVLFAGISKATAKLEEKLQEEGNQSEGVAFLKESMKATSSQLFPSASSERQQNLKSILKRKMGSNDKGEGESSSDATASKLSALEKTLQLLRGKSNIAELMEKKSPPPEVAKGALKNLALYNDDDDDEKYLYGDKKPTKVKTTGGDHPFWSVNAVTSETEASKKGKDSFDVQEKLFEQWRQTINTSSSGEYPPKEKGKTDVSIPRVDPFFQKKIQASMTEVSQPQTSKKNSEELDSTVQNILQSIGFNFDLSKRMQELARKKKMEENDKESGITDQSASFLSQGENLSAEMKASILKGETSIESLIKEVRARTQKGNMDRHRDESQSPERGAEWISHSQRQARDRSFSRSPSPDSRRSERSMSRSSQKRYEKKESEQWEAVSMEDWEEGSSNRHRQFRESGRERYQKSDITTPPRGKYLDDREAEGNKRMLERYSFLQSEERTSREQSAPHMSERFRSDDPKEEYFYPEDSDFSQRSSGLLTTIRSRPKEEDLSSGLFPAGPIRSQPKKMEVENLRVTSRPNNDDEPFAQTRRIILPVKSERVVVSRSPSGRESRSPGRRDMRKRSASPLQMPYSKERKMRESRDYDDYYDGYSERMPRRQSQSPDRASYHSSEQRGMPMGRMRDLSPYDRQREYSREQSPPYDTFKESRQYSVEYRSPPRDDFVSQRPLQQTSKLRSDWHTSSSGRRSRSQERYRSRSPERQRSRSPDRRRSRSPDRRRSRSLERRRSRSPDRQKFRSKGSRRSRDRRSRSKSPDRYGRFAARKRSPGRDRHHYSGRKWVPESYHGSRQNRKPDSSKYKLDRRADKSSSTRGTKIDMSKLTPEERKAQLQKMLKEKEKNAAATDPAPTQSTEKPLPTTAEVPGVPSAPVAAVSQPEDKAKQNTLQAIERLANFPVEVRKELLMKMSALPAVERKSILEDLSLRQERINTLKSQVDRLKKEQNEIMRKSQRTGLGDKDPQLVAKAESQLNLEKEIARLSSAEFYIAFNDDVILPMARKKEPPPKSKPAPSAPSSKATPAADITEEKDVKTEPQQAGVNPNWKSVTVKEEALPSIDPAKPAKEKSAPEEKKQQKKEAHSRSQSQSLSRSKQKVYYEYYDSGNHWCADCNTSCNTILQFFQHAHGKKHLQKMGTRRPWSESKGNSSQESSRKVGQALSRRVKGVEMMIPITGFYCTLCKLFCGDLAEGESHLKGDSHNEKYADFVSKNPMHEKRILLDKATAHSQRKKDGSSKSDHPPPPPPPLPKEKPSSKSKTESASREWDSKVKPTKKQFRVKEKTVEEGREDNTDIVDMDLDNVSDESSDTKSKVPKLSAKSSLATSWAPQPAAPSADMKKCKEDEDTPLDTFLSIEDEKKKWKLPVESMNISDIPVPQGPSLSVTGSDADQIPLPPLPEAEALPPLPPPHPNPEGVPTVKSLSDIQEEQKKIEDEEKRMMGIDVDAEVEQPLAVPRPPPSVSSLGKSEQDASGNAEHPRKPHGKTLDSLFAKLSRTVGVRPKPKVAASETKTEMEIKIQEEIEAKVEKEKRKMLRIKQREEEKERKKEEKLHQKQRMDTDSESSSEESESEEEEEEKEKLKAMSSFTPSASLTSGENVVSTVSDEASPWCDAGPEQVDNQDTSKVDMNTQPGVEEVTSSELESSLPTGVELSVGSGEDQHHKQVDRDSPKKPEEFPPVASLPSKGKKTTKMSIRGKKSGIQGKASIKEGFSDLTAFFSVPAETVSKEGQKKLVPKKTGVKKGKRGTSTVRRSTRGSMPATQEENQQEDREDSDVEFSCDEAMFGEDMIILSEVTEENDEVDNEMENQLSGVQDEIQEEKMEDQLDSNQGTETIEDRLNNIQSTETVEELDSELMPRINIMEESSSIELREPNEATEADISASDASVPGAKLSLGGSDHSEAGPVPAEADVPLSSPSPVRGKGRGKKSQRGSRGRGRGRKAASHLRAEKTWQEKEMSGGDSLGSDNVGSSQELGRSEEDSGLSPSLVEVEGESETRKTRSRRSAALPVKIERARRTRGRARKEEEEEEDVASTGQVFSEGSVEAVDQKPPGESEEQTMDDASVGTDVVSGVTDCSETVQEERNEDGNIEQEPIDTESFGTVPSNFDEVKHFEELAENFDEEAESMPSLHQFDSADYEKAVVEAAEMDEQDGPEVHQLTSQGIFRSESGAVETSLEDLQVTEHPMLEAQEYEPEPLQENIVAGESSGGFLSRDAVEDTIGQGQPLLSEAGGHEEDQQDADEIMPQLKLEHGANQGYHAERKESVSDSDSDATITEDATEDPNSLPEAPCAQESAHGFPHQASDEFAGQAESMDVMLNPGYTLETPSTCTEEGSGQADSTITDAYFVSTHAGPGESDDAVNETESGNSIGERSPGVPECNAVPFGADADVIHEAAGYSDEAAAECEVSEYRDEEDVKSVEDGSQQSSAQGRDVPLSGVVSEMEDTLMVPLGMGADLAQQSGQESDVLPTAGLSLGLEEDEDSMEFSMVGMEAKTEEPMGDSS